MVSSIPRTDDSNTIIWFCVFLSTANNLYTIISNNHKVSST